jgi:hypothetical protein
MTFPKARVVSSEDPWMMTAAAAAILASYVVFRSLTMVSMPTSGGT